MAKDPAGYTMVSYGNMVRCEPRMPAYAEALRRAVTPGCRVIDIGAGPGIFSVLACQYGAGSVVAIDPQESAELIAPIAEANGCADRITVVRGLSTDYAGEKADVIISDIRGILPLFEHHIASIADARERLLAPGGTLIPARDVLRAAIVTAPDAYRCYEVPWVDNRYAVDMSLGHRFVVNTFQKVTLGRDCLLSEPQDIFEFDYRSITDPNLDAGYDITITRAGLAHGILLWFDAELGDGIGFSNAPGEPPQIYGQTFYPFERPVDVVAGDQVSGTISAILLEGSYTWSWTSSFSRNGDPRGIGYRQSTFLSKVFDPAALQARTAGAVPQRRAHHDILGFCLGLIDGKRTLDEIATQLTGRFPDAFRDHKAALDFAARNAAIGGHNGAEGQDD